MDTRKIAERSYRRIAERTDDLSCPFCGRDLVVRMTTIGWCPSPESQRGFIDGVGMKCAGDDGCGFRPDFDVPLRGGYWPEMTGQEEYEQELGLRNGERSIDIADHADDVVGQLRDLGYVD